MRITSTLAAAVFLLFAASACDQEEEVEPTSPDYEKSLIGKGLSPMSESEAATFLNDVTIYFTFVQTKAKWIEYFSPEGVIAKSEIPEEPDKFHGARPLIFGSWWAEEDRTCFAYGSSDDVRCYRLYRQDVSLLLVQVTASTLTPEGALLARSTKIVKGNAENFPPAVHVK